MAITDTDNISTLSTTDTEADINLREYIRILANWWREILLLAILAVIVTIVAVLTVRRLQTPQYEASATVAIARIKNDIIFDERFRTLSDETVAIQRTNINSRRAALLGLVHSGAVAELVANELADQLSEEERVLARLLESIEATIVAGQSAKVESDLIRIKAVADSPQKAANIANAWAKFYVEEVNTIYGQVPPEVLESVEAELVNAKAVFGAAQKDLEKFVATNQVKKLQRLVDEKLSIINTLQAGKQTAIATIVDEELKARRLVITEYISALSENRLFGFQREQEAKIELLSKYIDAEIKSRIFAIQKDREVREAFFAHLANAQLQSATAVFDYQVQSKISQLQLAYHDLIRVKFFLEQALFLEDQIRIGGEAAAETNDSALAVLKAQIFTFPEIPTATNDFAEPVESTILEFSAEDEAANRNDDTVPSIINAPVVSAPVVNVTEQKALNNLQINLDLAPNPQADSITQLEDVTTLVIALEKRASQIETEITSLSQQILVGDDYLFLDQLVASELGVSNPISQSLTSMAGKTNEDTELSLSQAVTQSYLELFGTSELATFDELLTEDSALFAEIRQLYPQLFELDTLAQLTDDVPQDNPLANVSVEKAQQLLQLQGLEDIPSYTAAAEPLIQAIDQLEQELQKLEAQLEAERSLELQLTQQRDLAASTLQTLNNKAAELHLAGSATNSEVKLASPAVAPIEPIQANSLLLNALASAIIGLMIGIFIAFFAHFMGQEPWLYRYRKESITG